MKYKSKKNKNNKDRFPITASSRRKRCNRCEHFVYGCRGKDVGYICKATGRFTKNYRILRHCMAPTFKKKAKKTDIL